MTEPSVREQAASELPNLLRNRAFLQMWSAQLLSQTATNAIIYALMVLIEQRTQSSVYMSLLVLSTIVPSVVFGLGAGVFVDRWSKREVLWVTNALRAVVVMGFLPASLATPAAALAWFFPGTGVYALVLGMFTAFYENLFLNLLLIYGMNLVFSTITQFFAPAEIAMVPALVQRKQLIEANGLFNFTFTGAQLLGFVFFGPALVKSLGLGAVFVAMSIMFTVAALLTRTLPASEPVRVVTPLGRDLLGGILAELREGWAVISRDKLLTLAIMNFTVANAMMMIFGTLAPGYVNRVLGIQPEDAVWIIAPAGIGILLGIATLRSLIARFGREQLANGGLFVTSLVLYGLGALGNVGPGLEERGNAFLSAISRADLPILVGMVMSLALVFGVAFAMINVPAQTTLQERTPEDKRGRVFATQLTFTNVVAILPLIFLSGLADLLGIPQVILLTATIVLVIAFYSRRRTQVTAQVAMEREH